MSEIKEMISQIGTTGYGMLLYLKELSNEIPVDMDGYMAIPVNFIEQDVKMSRQKQETSLKVLEDNEFVKVEIKVKQVPKGEYQPPQLTRHIKLLKELL